MDKNRESWLQKLTESARSQIKAREEFDLTEGVLPGDRFLLRGVPDVPVSWVAILPNKDDPSLWYFVAADYFTYVGVCDVVADPIGDAAPLVLRCAHGLWIREADLPKELFVGRVDPALVDYASEKLQLMVTGELVGTPTAELIDVDLDYIEWAEQIDEAVSFLENRIQREVLIYPLVDLARDQQSQYAAGQSFAMAAASGDSISADDDSPLPRRSIVDDMFPGRLEITDDEDGLRAVYHPAEDERPEDLILVDGEQFVCNWGAPIGKRFLLDMAIPKTGEQISLTFSSGKTVRIDINHEA